MLNKEGGSLAVYMVCRWGGLQKFWSFQHFSLPPLPYINNDRSLNKKCICWVSQWLDTQQPGNVFKILDIQLQQCEIHIPFSHYAPFNSSKKIYLFRRHICLGFGGGGIFKLRHTMKSQCFWHYIICFVALLCCFVALLWGNQLNN